MASVATPGMKGIDYSGARPSPAATRKAGAGFVIRYSAGVGNSAANTQWKLCGKGEIAAAVAAGCDFIANSEYYESRITEGAGAGRADGTADRAFWINRGLAKGASIFVSWDQAPARGKWDAAVAYLRAYQAALGGYYFVDCYAGTPFLRYALGLKVIRYGWRPNAGSWSGDGLPYQPRVTPQLLDVARKATPAAIWQTGNYWWSKQADENVLLRPVGSHLAAVKAAQAAAKPAAPAKPAASAKPATPAPAAPAAAQSVPVPIPVYSTPGTGLFITGPDNHLEVHRGGRVVATYKPTA